MMSPRNRLDQMIVRLWAQRNCLAHAAGLIADVPGPVLAFGLGEGRAYDFLRHTLPNRRIFAFDRDLHCPPDCAPEPDRLILGAFFDTVPDALARIGEPAALAHFDVGSEDPVADFELIGWLATAADPLIGAGGIVVADRAMRNPRWSPLPLPAQGGGDSQFLYRVMARGSPRETL